MVWYGSWRIDIVIISDDEGDLFDALMDEVSSLTAAEFQSSIQRLLETDAPLRRNRAKAAASARRKAAHSRSRSGSSRESQQSRLDYLLSEWDDDCWSRLLDAVDDARNADDALANIQLLLQQCHFPIGNAFASRCGREREEDKNGRASLIQKDYSCCC